ncbi:MAG TPA: DUF2530 domain-containing protein [Actinomycetes bacterium]|nr:DUF2530 domain-containing protein [Actinomycetes bacterium]
MGRTQRYNRIEPYRPPDSGADDQASGAARQEPPASSRSAGHGRPRPRPDRSAPVKPRSHAKPDAELQELQAVDVDGVAATTIGTVVWAAAFLIMLPFRSDLEANGRGDWLWICLAGVVGGLFGIVYCRRRRASMARANRAHRRSSNR